MEVFLTRHYPCLIQISPKDMGHMLFRQVALPCARRQDKGMPFSRP
ncbi:MAG: hypothetical protein ACI8RD_002382 [Bacillariaceae sp.]|jgi:hypothetical protein